MKCGEGFSEIGILFFLVCEVGERFSEGIMLYFLVYEVWREV